MSNSSRATDGTPLRFASITPPPNQGAQVESSRSPSMTSASDVDVDDTVEEEEEEEDESAEESDLDLLDERIARRTAVLNPALVTPSVAHGTKPWPYTSVSQSSPALTVTSYAPMKIPASSLPHEILLHILRLLSPVNLSPALLVCKAWCQCGVELLWHKPSFSNLGALLRMLIIIGSTKIVAADVRFDAEDSTMTVSTPSSPSSSSVESGMQVSFDSKVESSVALRQSVVVLAPPRPPTLLERGTTFPYPAFIRRLNFSSLSAQITDGIILRLAPCIFIERLTLTSCVSLTSPALCGLLRHCSRLIALDLSEVVSVEDSVLEEVAKGCKRLQGLNLSGCVQVTDLGVEAVARGCPGLRRIKLRSLHLLTDVPIILLSISCPLLLEVDLVACQLITSISLRQLFRTSGHLRELSLAGCSEVDDAGFPCGSDDGRSNDYLSNGGGYEDRSLVVAAAAAAPPTFLPTLTGAPILCPLALTNPPALSLFDHLRYLDLTSLSLLTDAALEGIVKYMPRIRNLILAKCVGITDFGVESICKLGKALHYLHLGHVSSITDRAVTRLARSCTRLRYIDLACCNLLTDMSVFELATNLPRLKRIGLVRVASLTDQAIYALFARPSLERIHLSYCENITLQAIHDLLQHLPRLTHLSLTGVPAFRREDLQKWCRTPPRDFNSHQRSSFCVYSGPGVRDLRRYLRSMATPAPVPASSATSLVGGEAGGEGGPVDARNGAAGAGGAATTDRPHRAQRAHRHATTVPTPSATLTAVAETGALLFTPPPSVLAPSRRSRDPTHGVADRARVGSERRSMMDEATGVPAAETSSSRGTMLGRIGSSSSAARTAQSAAALQSPFGGTASSGVAVASGSGSNRRSSRHQESGGAGGDAMFPEYSIASTSPSHPTLHHQQQNHHLQHHPLHAHPTGGGSSATTRSTNSLTSAESVSRNRSRRSTVTRGNYLRTRSAGNMEVSGAEARGGAAGVGGDMDVDEEDNLTSDEDDRDGDDVEMG